MVRRAVPVSGVLLAALLTMLLVPAPARGTTYEVGCSVGELRTAITSANATAAADTINLAQPCTYSFADTAATGVLLPRITTPITINGATNPLSVRATLARGTAPRTTAMFYVEGAGSLQLRNLNIDGGGTSTLSDAAIVSYGTLAMSGVALTNHYIGMHIYGGIAVLTGMTTSGNSRTMYTQGATTIEDSSLSGNRQQGSCIHSPGVTNINGGHLTIRRVTFADNTGCVGTSGGGIHNASGNTVVVEDSTFSGGRVGSDGGAIWNGGTLQVLRSTFTDNRGFHGGAIYSPGVLTVTDSVFTLNQAATPGGFGGAIRSGADGSAAIVRSSFAENLAGSGGALALLSTTSTVENSTFHANTARRFNAVGRGGGIYVLNGTATLRHLSFGANQALDYGQGGGIYNDGGAVTAIGLLMGIGAGGTCGGPTALIDGGGNVTDGRYFCPEGFANRSFTFGTYGTYGGLTPVLPLARADAAVDVVPAGQCLPTDQRGVVRPQHQGCDAGAWEDRAPTAPGVPTLASGTSPGRGDDLALSWSGATDPDGTALTYRLEHRDADDGGFTHAATVADPSHAFTPDAPETEGTWRYRVVATDGSISVTGGAAEWQVVVDRTPPATPTGSPDRDPDAVAPDLTEWWADTLTVTFAPGADPALPDGTPGTGTTSTTDPATLTATGTPAATSTDAVGNVSAPTDRTFHVDAAPPTVEITDCPASVERGATAAVHWQATDAEAGVDGPTAGEVALDTATLGPHVATTPPVSDLVGHTATAATCSYEVVAPPPVATTTELRVRHLEGRKYRAIATVRPAAATGKVILRDGTRRIATGTTDATSSVVRLDVRLDQGRHRLRALYVGSDEFVESRSTVVVVVVR